MVHLRLQSLGAASLTACGQTRFGARERTSGAKARTHFRDL